MAKEQTHIQSRHAMLPLTSEARETSLNDLFGGKVPHYGQLFLPNDTFYGNHTSITQANHMLQILCRWLGIKPGYIGLTTKTGKAAIPDGRKYTIRLSPHILENEFLLGAFLAYELTGYLVEHQNKISIQPDQTDIIAHASVLLGLGLVIANGLSPKYGWLSYVRQKKPNLINTFPESSYSYLLRSFIKKQRIQPLTFMPFVAPWTAKRLGIKNQQPVSGVVLNARHSIRLINLKIIAMIWLVILLCGVGGFVISKQIRPVSVKTLQAQEKLTVLQGLKQKCDSDLTYNRQYADLTDIQTLRKLNADQLTCQSLKNQQNAAEHDYQLLSR